MLSLSHACMLITVQYIQIIITSTTYVSLTKKLQCEYVRATRCTPWEDISKMLGTVGDEFDRKHSYMVGYEGESGGARGATSTATTARRPRWRSWRSAPAAASCCSSTLRPSLFYDFERGEVSEVRGSECWRQIDELTSNSSNSTSDLRNR